MGVFLAELISQLIVSQLVFTKQLLWSWLWVGTGAGQRQHQAKNTRLTGLTPVTRDR